MRFSSTGRENHQLTYLAGLSHEQAHSEELFYAPVFSSHITIARPSHASGRPQRPISQARIPLPGFRCHAGLLFRTPHSRTRYSGLRASSRSRRIPLLNITRADRRLPCTGRRGRIVSGESPESRSRLGDSLLAAPCHGAARDASDPVYLQVKP